MTARTLNRRLAELTGWSNIVELGGALLGTPPAGEPQCRGQAKVPNWEGDWRDCGPLIDYYSLRIEVRGWGAKADAMAVRTRDCANSDEALRRAIVAASICCAEAIQ